MAWNQNQQQQQYGQQQYGQQYPGPAQDVISGEQYRYALTNFRIAHDKVESQRQQLEEQEKQIAILKDRITILEGGDEQGIGRAKLTSSVDDFSIKNAASQLERLINRWAADVIRTPPAQLPAIREAALADLSGSQSTTQGTPSVVVQNLLRHCISEIISEGIVNVLVVTNSNEANSHLTRIHEHIFSRDPTVASVWRRQTFSAAVEQCSAELSSTILFEHIPTVAALLTPATKHPDAAVTAILESAYAFSRMLHGSKTTSGGAVDAFYRAFVPELGSVLYPRQIELVKRCLKSENGDIDRVGACVFPGLVKISKTALNAPKGPDGQPAPELTQTVVRRAQVICECALGLGHPAGPTGPHPPQGYA